MAIETIEILDANSVAKKVLADLIGSTDYAQVMKVAYGSDGTLTLAETSAPLPVTLGSAVLDVELAPTYELLTYGVVSAASNNAAVVKNSAGGVFGWYLHNAALATRVVKLFNKATAPSPGTDTPLVRIPLAAGSSANVISPKGISFTTGIGIAIVAGIADSDNTSVSVNDVVANVFYA